MRKARLIARDSATSVIHAIDGRRTIAQSALGTVEEIGLSAESCAPFGFTTSYRVSIAYLGAAHWSVAGRTRIIDSNRTLMLYPGDEFEDRQAGRKVGRASIVLTPSEAMTDELLWTADARGTKRAMSLPASMQLRILAHHLLALDFVDPPIPFMTDELMIAALRESLRLRDDALRSPTKAVERAKEELHNRDICDEARLDGLARTVGCSPTYLSWAFRQCEGLPLYRYSLRLRLTQLLIDLPDADDLTALALDYGFSSHSHFSTAFHAAFGMAPSRLRNDLRARRTSVAQHLTA